MKLLKRKSKFDGNLEYVSLSMLKVNVRDRLKRAPTRERDR